MTTAPGPGAAPTGSGPRSLPTGADQPSTTTPTAAGPTGPTGDLAPAAAPVGAVYRVGDSLVVRAGDGRWRYLRPHTIAPAPPLGLEPVMFA